MPYVSFDSLWRAHPGNEKPKNVNPCSGQNSSGFQHQCTIRLGVAFARCDLSLASYRGGFCWSGHGREHPLRAEEMKLWLNGLHADFVGIAEIARRNRQGRQRSSQLYSGRQGIVMCRNFWGTGDTGDHIDLWNGEKLALGENYYFEVSQEIWFWDMT